MDEPTIVIAAFNRPDSLTRLLRSVERLDYPVDPRLVISIDYSGSDAVNDVARNFRWAGEKIVLRHEKQLGLKHHILKCGDLTAQFGVIILLEDDLIVSPHFYRFAVKALDFFAGNERIAGISLYNYSYNETACLPFHALAADSSNYFAKLPSSWGQVWTHDQWQSFIDWYELCGEGDNWIDLPPNIRDWPETSWKKDFARYLVDKEKYFVYPGRSFSTNCGEPGNHVIDKLHKWVSVMTIDEQEFKFCDLDKSCCIYDAYLELEPRVFKKLNGRLKDYEFVVDLNGQKSRELTDDELVLTTLPAKDKIIQFGLELKPIELNIIWNVQGTGIHLCKVGDIVSYNKPRKLVEYFYPIDNWILPVIVPPIPKQLLDRLEKKSNKSNIFRLLFHIYKLAYGLNRK